MLNRNPKSFDELAQGWGRLVESTQPASKATAARGRQGLLIESKLGVDGKFYGILKEADGYYVKTALNEGAGTPAADAFAYIGGEANRVRERFASLPVAQRRVHLKLHALNESASAPRHQNVDELLQQLDAVPAAPAPAEVAPAPEAALDAPLPEAPAAEGEAPAAAGGGLEGALNADPNAAPEGELPGLDADPNAAPAPEGDEDGGEVTADKILSMVGKLGAAIDKLGPQNLTPQLTKAVINPTLTHLSPGIQAMEPGDREELTGRIEGGAEPMDEEAVNMRDAGIQSLNSAASQRQDAVMSQANGDPYSAADSLGSARDSVESARFKRDMNQNGVQNQYLAQTPLGKLRTGVILPEEADLLAGAENELAEAREEQERQASHPGPKGHFHSDDDIEAMEREIELKKHEVELAKWNQKKPVHPFEKEQLHEGAMNPLDVPYDLTKRRARYVDSITPTGTPRATAAAHLQNAQVSNEFDPYDDPEAEKDARRYGVEDAKSVRLATPATEFKPAGLAEGIEDFDDSDTSVSGENHAHSEFADGFRSFCEYRGYDVYQDEDLAAAIGAWAKVVTAKNSPYDADIEGVADALNPYVLEQIKGHLPADFVAAVEAELHAQNAPQPEAAPLNEGLQALLRGLVAEQVEFLTEGRLSPEEKEKSFAHTGSKPLKVKGKEVHDGYGDSKTHNRPQYSHYVVGDGKIHSGWETSSDAKDHADELSETGNKHKVYTGSHLKSKLSIDPDHNHHWAV